MSLDVITYRIQDLARRVESLEEYEPAVMSAAIRSLSEEVKSLRTAFYTFAISVVTGAVLFAFTAFKVVG